jgi:transcriptional regulator with XRE-family HTH domain
MKTFGDLIKNLRESRELTLRIVSAYLDIDQAILSKIEGGLRKANRDLVIRLSSYFEIDKNELLVAWLFDKLVLEIGDEETALKALQLAEEKLIYHKKSILN